MPITQISLVNLVVVGVEVCQSEEVKIERTLQHDEEVSSIVAELSVSDWQPTTVLGAVQSEVSVHRQAVSHSQAT